MSFIDVIKDHYLEHKTEWKIGTGCVLSAVAVVEAFIVAPKAIRVLEDLKEIHEKDEDRKQYAKDVCKKVVPLVSLPIATEALAISCVVSGTRDCFSEILSISSAYALSERERLLYKNKNLEMIGEKKEKEVTDEVAKSKVTYNNLNTSSVVDTGFGTTYVYETLSRTFIKSSVVKIERSANEMNKRIISGCESYITVDEWLYELGIPELGNATGNLCFTSDREITPIWTSNIDENGIPYAIVSYLVDPGPRPDYTGSKY